MGERIVFARNRRKTFRKIAVLEYKFDPGRCIFLFFRNSRLVLLVMSLHFSVDKINYCRIIPFLIGFLLSDLKNRVYVADTVSKRTKEIPSDGGQMKFIRQSLVTKNQ